MGIAPILVVDDEPDMRSALSHALHRCGFEVESAASGSEAVTKFKKNTYSLVVSDIRMPGMSGVQLLEKIRNISLAIPVIMITAYGTINNAVEAMQEGAADYILKPFSFETLEAAVKKAITSGKGNVKAGEDTAPAVTSTAAKTIITQNPAVMELLTLAENVASSQATILIQGQSGTGKELLAAFIHAHSHQKQGPYVAVNCAALPENLAESELFGHEKGAFTGAVNRKIGKFELAKHGTIVLDEISEMPLALQAKLLRVLQEREIDRVGGTRPIAVNARVIAISNVDLKKAVSEGTFREDLYYRINVIPMTIPPLRDRKDDIVLLANFFLEKFSTLNGRETPQFSTETLEVLLHHDWKGNVRELENAIERALLIGNGDSILPVHLILGEPDIPDSASATGSALTVGTTVRQMEKKLIVKTLQEVNENRTRAAELLGISIRTLRNKLREYKNEDPGRSSATKSSGRPVTDSACRPAVKPA
jgi:DNA-binding NtrC family response regulator